MITVDSPQPKIIKKYQDSIRKQKYEFQYQCQGYYMDDFDIYDTERECKSMLSPSCNLNYTEIEDFDFLRYFLEEDLDKYTSGFMVSNIYKLCRKHLDQSVSFYTSQEIDKILFSLKPTSIKIIKNKKPTKNMEKNYLTSFVKYNSNLSLKYDYEKFIYSHYNSTTTDIIQSSKATPLSDSHVWFASVEVNTFQDVFREKTNLYHNHNYFLLCDDRNGKIWDNNSLLIFKFKKKQIQECADLYLEYTKILNY
jgi:hypothetical protein